MLFKKNLPQWERALRFAGAIAMVAYGLVLLRGQMMGYMIAGAGVFTAVTALFGFCPACAMVGRKLESNG